MRISPIVNFSYTKCNHNNNVPQKRNAQVNFKGESNEINIELLIALAFKKFFEKCEDAMIDRVARRYMFVKNYEDLLLKEFPDDYEYRQELSRRIKRMESEFKDKDIKINGLVNKIDDLGAEIENINTENSGIKESINNTNLKNSFENQRAKIVLRDVQRQKKIYDALDEQYLALSRLENKVYPNGIMIKGTQSQEEIEKTLKYLQDKGCLLLRTSFSKNDQKQAAKEMVGLLKRIREGDKHGILYIEDFREHTVPSEKNRRFIDKLKAHLCSCSKDSNATILIFENNPQDIDEILLKEHRFGTKIDVSDIKHVFEPGFVPKKDGYTFYYGQNENDTVDLYLGNFGHNREILWVDEPDQDKALKVLENIDLVKSQEKFKDIKYLQMRKPVKVYKIYEDFYTLNHKTADYHPIIEKKLNIK